MRDITITGHSGDQVCPGVLDEICMKNINDPCQCGACCAFINFTANKDIYIYPMNKSDVFGFLTLPSR